MVDSDFKEPEEGGPPPKKGNLTTIIIIAVIALVMGAGGFFAGKILSGGEQIDNTAQTGDAKAGGGETRTRASGEIPGKYTGEDPRVITGGEVGERPEEKGRQGLLSLETFTVNLNDP